MYNGVYLYNDILFFILWENKFNIWFILILKNIILVYIYDKTIVNHGVQNYNNSN